MPGPKEFKVCLVSISLAKGGLERSCALLSQMLKNCGHEVHLVILNNEIDYPFSGKLLNLGEMKSGKDSIVKRLLRFQKFRNYLKSKPIFLLWNLEVHLIDGLGWHIFYNKANN